jgi:beta-xylosidase
LGPGRHQLERAPAPLTRTTLTMINHEKGEYRNPVLPADYSDPDVIRDGEDFYLTASSFNCVPGLPILHSRDLVHWTIVNHALQRLPHARYDQVQHGCGVWAPSIRRHAGKFWIFFAMPDEGIYVTTADHPKGRWSEPHLMVASKGLIDPCPLWDDNGQAYLVFAYAFSRCGIKHKLRLCPMAPDGSHLLGDGFIVVDGTERHPTLEGPKFLKKDGYYYILAPAGGVATGWQVAFRSRNIEGPYEEKIVLAQGTTAVNGPHQGALVDTPDGEWWFLHFQERQPFGRVVHLQPACWRDGWPLMGCNHNANGVGQPVGVWRSPRVASPVSELVPQDSDAFDGATLGPQWQWQANPQRSWHSLSDRPEHLRLFAQSLPPDDFRNAPNLLLQKLQARAQAVSVNVQVPQQAGIRAGLVIFGIEHASVALRSGRGKCKIVTSCNGQETVLAETSRDAAELGVIVDAQGRCTFRFRSDGSDWETVPDTFEAKEGVWVGAKVGIFAVLDPGSESRVPHQEHELSTLYADFHHFSVSDIGPPAASQSSVTGAEPALATA